MRRHPTLFLEYHKQHQGKKARHHQANGKKQKAIDISEEMGDKVRRQPRYRQKDYEETHSQQT